MVGLRCWESTSPANEIPVPEERETDKGGGHRGQGLKPCVPKFSGFDPLEKLGSWKQVPGPGKLRWKWKCPRPKPDGPGWERRRKPPAPGVWP